MSTTFSHRRHVFLGAGLALLLLVVLWLFGLILFAWSIPNHIEDSQTPTDAIVILTGGSDRIDTGLALLIDNKAERAFVSGMDPVVTLEKVVKLSGQPAHKIRTRIDGGHSARDTEGNARESAEWMHKNRFRSLRLVTSSYHMPRSLLEFKRALPDVWIIPHPVFTDRVRPSRWWDSPGTVSLIMSEYNKYVLSLLAGYLREPPQGRS